MTDEQFEAELTGEKIGRSKFNMAPKGPAKTTIVSAIIVMILILPWVLNTRATVKIIIDPLYAWAAGVPKAEEIIEAAPTEPTVEETSEVFIQSQWV